MLNLSSAAGSSEKKATNDSKNWANVPKVLAFPNEISEIGYAVFGHTDLTQVNNDNELIKSGEEDALDVFHSTTAKLTSDKPFLALSDERYIYLFRQPTTDEKLLAKNSTPQLDDDGQEVRKDGHAVMSDVTPLVHNGAILMDRFVLSGATLKLCRELRYQRSRDKTNPKSAKDTLSGQDIEGKPFYEPTRQLPFISNIVDNGFTVTLLPDGLEEGDGKRWQIFYVDKGAKKLCSISIKYDVEVVFDFRDQASAIEQFLAEKKLNHIEIFRTIKAKLNGGQQANTIVPGLINEQASLEDEDADYLGEIVNFCRNGLLMDETSLLNDAKHAVSITSGMSACMYYQKTDDDKKLGAEKVVSQAKQKNKNKKTKKQKACVMLALGLEVDGKKSIGIITYDLAKGGIITNINKDTVELAKADLCHFSKQEVEGHLKTLGSQITQSKNTLTRLLRNRRTNIQGRKGSLVGKSFSKGQLITASMFSSVWERYGPCYDDAPVQLAEDIKQCEQNIQQYQAALCGIDVVAAVRQADDFSNPITVSYTACGTVFTATAKYTGNRYFLPSLTNSGRGKLSQIYHYKAMQGLNITHSDKETADSTTNPPH